MKRVVRVGVYATVVALIIMMTTSATDARIAGSGASVSTQLSTSFVTRSGAQLLLDGQPFQFTGVNIYNANSDGWCRDALSDADLIAAFHALGRGQVVVRAWFFQSLATTKWTGERDWTRFDRTLALARQAGVHVIATLTDQWGECGDGNGAGYKTKNWYAGGYSVADPTETDPLAPHPYAKWDSYLDYVQQVVNRYQADPTIMAWQLINEAEAKAGQNAGCDVPEPSPSAGPGGPTPPPGATTPPPEPSAEAVLRSWADTVSTTIRGLDSNHLISLGTIGTGQCGAEAAEYQDLHTPANIDLCEYHDYSLAAMPGDQWNGLQVRLDQCASLGKPLFVGETGIIPNDLLDNTFEGRSALFDSKFTTQFAAGVVGELMWNYSRTPSTLDNYDIGPGDPALRRFQSVPLAPTTVVAAAGDGTATVAWRAPSSDGGTDLIDYTIFGNGNAVGTVTASLTSASVSVANGTSYTFAVVARNAIGLSAASSPSISVTPQTGAAPPAVVTSDVPAGSSTTVTTGPAGATPSDPLTTTVTVPATVGGGSISVVETAPTVTPPSGYQLLGQQIDIVSTAATSASNPLTIVFTVDETAVRTAFGLGPTDTLPAPDSVDITRAEGSGSPTVIPACTNAVAPIAPDPCVSARAYLSGGDLQATVLTGSASHWTTVVRPVTVTVVDAGYKPRAVSVKQGGVVLWTFSGVRAHTVTDASRLGPPTKPALFNSGPLLTGRFGYVFRAAGTYPYLSIARGDPTSMSGAVEVPVRASPTTGTASTTFAVTWSSAPIPGYVFDISYRFQQAGSTAWTEWKWQAGQTATTRSFTPSRGPGTYALIARLRNSATGNASLWSPEARIVVR